MKITSVDLYELKYKYNKKLVMNDALGTSKARQGLLIRIETDSNIYGIGEAWSYGSPTRIQKAIIEDQLVPILIGQDPTKIEWLFQKMYWRTIAHGRRGLIMGAISGLDIALWDILGKVANMPIYKLLGGHSNIIPSYACGGFYSNSKSKEDLKDEISGWLNRGYQLFKIKVGRDSGIDSLPLKYVQDYPDSISLDEDLERVTILRKMIGNKKIIIDLNAAWNSETMKYCIDSFADAKVDCIEEPFQFEDINAYQELRKYYPKGLIMGFETEQNPFNFAKYIDKNMVDIVEPDIGWAGGFTTTKKIANEAEVHFKMVSMHSFGSAVHFAASLQMAAAVPNVFPIESEENYNPLRSDILQEGFKTDNHMNYILSDKPGLGINVDWKKVEKYKK